MHFALINGGDTPGRLGSFIPRIHANAGMNAGSTHAHARLVRPYQPVHACGSRGHLLGELAVKQSSSLRTGLR